MQEKSAAAIAQALREVPEGTFAFLRHDNQTAQGRHMVDQLTTRTAGDQLTTRTAGRGRIESYLLYPGIELSYHQYLAEQMHFCHRASDSVLEINHCRQGRIGWKMNEGISVYLGAGDLCLHTQECCADSEILLPLGYYEGSRWDIMRASTSPSIWSGCGAASRRF